MVRAQVSLSDEWSPVSVMKLPLPKLLLLVVFIIATAREPGQPLTEPLATAGPLVRSLTTVGTCVLIREM